MTRRSLFVAALAAALAPAGAAGQAPWDAPTFLRPGAPARLTLALTEGEPADGLGFMALWRGAAAPVGLGFRAGLVEAPVDDLAAFFGVDLSGSLTGPLGPGQPEAIWWTGAGVGLGDEVSASFPLGLVLGWTARAEGVAFMPYLGGHVVLDARSGPGDALDLEGVVDLGLDLGLAGGWMVRFSAALGGREALALGVRLPG